MSGFDRFDENRRPWTGEQKLSELSVSIKTVKTGQNGEKRAVL